MTGDVLERARNVRYQSSWGQMGKGRRINSEKQQVVKSRIEGRHDSLTELKGSAEELR